MEFSLQPAPLDNLQIVLTWVSTPQELRLWGGPALTFPPVPERTWHEIGATDQNTFALIDPEGKVAGLGQTLWRDPDTVHLGRIIVSPALRGKGLGRTLCRLLIQAGSTLYHPAKFTLNVDKDNAPAYNLYGALGFKVLSEDPEQLSVKMCLQVEPGFNRTPFGE